MLSLKDIRQYVANLGIVDDEHVYIGKMDNKNPRSIGVYGRSSSGPPGIALGGLECTTYETRSLSLLVHWNKCKIEAEEAAFSLFERLRTVTNLIIGDTHIDYLRLMVPEPQDVGTDDHGVYEYVIWFDLIYERKCENV